jgi:hypothetical protein
LKAIALLLEILIIEKDSTEATKKMLYKTGTFLAELMTNIE